ncbi:MAG: hypothetical protein ACR2GN_03935 [Bacteroidia bacterium]|nr:hypothetical protein [Nitrosopumilus sp.]
MNNKIQQLRDEIVSNCNLNEFADTLYKILNLIYASDCLISCCDIYHVSSIEQSIDNSKKSHIRISLKHEKSIHIIWDILHEFGHHLSGNPNGNEKTLERENKAWDIAHDYLKSFSDLVKYKTDFHEYRTKNIETYLK